MPKQLPPDIADWVRNMFRVLSLGPLSESLGAALEGGEMRDAETMRGALGARIAPCAAPKHAAPDEGTAIDAQRRRIVTSLAAARTDADFDRVASALDELERVTAAVAEQVKVRRARATALARRLKDLAADASKTGGTSGTAMATAVPLLAAHLTAPWTDSALDAAQQQIERLGSDLASGVALSADQTRADLLAARVRTALVARAGALAPDRRADHHNAHLQLLTALSGTPSTELLDEIETQIAALEAEIATAEETLRQAATALEAEIAGQVAPEDAAPDEVTEFDAERERLMTAIVGEATPESHAAIRAALAALKTRGAQIAVEVTRRGEAAAKLRTAAGALSTPDGAPPGESNALSTLRAAVGRALGTPLTDAALEAGAAALAALETRRDQIGQAVAARQQRAAELKGQAAGVGDPAGAAPSETAALAGLRKALEDALAEPLDAAAVAAGETALQALQDLAGEIGDAVEDRQKRRGALEKSVRDAIMPGGMESSERAQFERERARLLAAAPVALEEVDLQELVSAGAAFVTALASHGTLVVARQTARAKAAEVLAAIKGAARELDSSAFLYLIDAAKAAEADIAKAKTEADYTTAHKKVLAAEKALPKAKTFGKAYRAFMSSSDLAIKFQIGASDVAAAQTARKEAMEKAQAKALTGDFTGAAAELDGFATTTGVSSDDMTKAASYADASLEFERTHRSAFDKAVKFETNDAGVTTLNDAYLAALADARAGNYQVAEQKFSTLVAALTDPDRQAFIATYRSYKTLSSDTDVNAALTAAKADYGTDDFVAGMGQFNALPESTKDTARYKALFQRASNRRALLRKAVPLTLFAPLETLYNDAKSAASAGNHAEAATKLGALETGASELETRFALWKPLLARRERLDPGDAEGVMSTEETAALANPGALPETARIGQLSALLDGLEAYLSRIARAEELKRGLPATAPADLATDIDAAISEALSLATQRKWADGAARLDTLLSDRRIALRTAEVETYLALRARVQARVGQVRAMLENVAVRTKLDDALKAALAHADPGGDYAMAATALEAVLDLADETEDYAWTRRTARRAIKGIQRAYAATVDHHKTAMDAQMSQTDITNRAAAAEALAAGTPPDMKGARTAYKKLMERLKPLMTRVAEIFEMQDMVDSNAGHSIDRHGPEVPKDLLLRRLQEGIDPLGNPAATSTSSQFDDIEDWLACRERAIERAATATDGPPINIGDTELPCAASTKLSKQVIIEHAKPIDRAFDGRGPKPEVDADGSVREGRQHETYRELKGLTRTRTLFIFELAAPDGGDEKPKNWKEYRTRWRALPQNASAPSSEPANMGGRWVVMQHFPEAGGWDQDRGTYE